MDTVAAVWRVGWAAACTPTIAATHIGAQAVANQYGQQDGHHEDCIGVEGGMRVLGSALGGAQAAAEQPQRCNLAQRITHSMSLLHTWWLETLQGELAGHQLEGLCNFV